MNDFTSTFGNTTRTANGMVTNTTSGSACVDLFFNIGASRGKDISKAFWAAYSENPDYALRIALWARDVRQGAGERQVFRDILKELEENGAPQLYKVMDKIPELGRWDDLLSVSGDVSKVYAFKKIAGALTEGNGLAAKWMPRKGRKAAELRSFLGMSPKHYRKTLVGLTSVVETQMCNNDWDNIDYEKVPSLASARYKKAFARHGKTFETYVEKVLAGEAKVNSSAVYPYDVLKTCISNSVSGAERGHIVAQWDALPNYMGDKKLLPMIDVSASMTWFNVGESLNGLEAAVSLGLYMATKNTGEFNDIFATFSSDTELVKLSGSNIVEKVSTMTRSHWSGSTNIVNAFKAILAHALRNDVCQDDMPDYLAILSDMQFNYCANFDDSALESLKRQYDAAGYQMPKVIFWNLNAKGGSPVTVKDSNTALVSGFSPTIAKTVLAADEKDFTPEGIMLKTILSSRYDL